MKAERTMTKNINHGCIENLIADCKLVLKCTAKAGESACNSCQEGLQLKAQSLSILSHELLTPLNGIIGTTDLALDLEMSDEARELIELANESALVLLNTIQDVLLLSKIVSGNFPLFPDPITPSRLMAAIWTDLLEKARAKHLTLKLDLAANLPASIEIDIDQMRRVLLILIGNAIKFTEQGSVAIRVEPQDAIEGGLHICIADTGIGIAPEKLDLIFAPFIQADSGLARKYDGLGIGLAIAWQLIDLMGGELVVDSELGKGSRFHIFLPR
jgi:signal transduction histidine kinase